MITVKVYEHDFLEMLEERVAQWTDDYVTRNLFSIMYENYIDGGCFDGCELDIRAIVDNDYINWCSVICDGDDEYEGIKALYDENGCGDISCEHEQNGGYSFIEAEFNGCFLMRS